MPSSLEIHRKKRDPVDRRAGILARLDALGAPRGEVSARTQPLALAESTDRPPSGSGWIFEVKYDGVRILAERRDEDVRLYGRSRQDVTARYPEVVGALRSLAVARFVLDGEVVAFDESGKPSFQRLQERMHLSNPRDVERARTAVPVVAVFFDCLALDGRDLRRLPLVERKECLRLVLPPQGVAAYGDHLEGDGEAFFRAASEQGLEGILAKRARAAYPGARTRDWLKVKCHKRQEFVIGGFTEPEGSRGFFGALHLGVYEDGDLVYVSKVGTGFDGETLRRTFARLEPLRRSGSPFARGSPKGRGHHWVEPKLVCEVRFTDWTRDGGVRHPSFLGLRDDKQPEECRREGDVGTDGHRFEPPKPPEPPRPEARFRITNPKKVFWPDEGYTKTDLVTYYETIAPWMLPYLKDRPLVLTRYPDGIRGKSFFQKDAPEFVPDWIRTGRISSGDGEREIDYFVGADTETLRYLANLGTIPIHAWFSRIGSIDRPDYLVLDLDPKGAPFRDVVEVALVLRGILDDLELASFPKTSGATGLHILLPLAAHHDYEAARSFARLLAMLVVDEAPKISTVARPLGSREGKVYVDWGQNGHGQTIVAPFSVRPLPEAPVSFPLRWKDVGAKLDPRKFTIRTAAELMERRGDPLAPVLGAGIDMAGAIAAIEKRLRG